MKNALVGQRLRNGVLKSQVASQLPPWEWRSGYIPTLVLLLSAQNPPGRLATLVWKDQGATLLGAENNIAHMALWARKARNIKEHAPNQIRQL